MTRLWSVSNKKQPERATPSPSSDGPLSVGTRDYNTGLQHGTTTRDYNTSVILLTLNWDVHI